MSLYPTDRKSNIVAESNALDRDRPSKPALLVSCPTKFFGMASQAGSECLSEALDLEKKIILILCGAFHGGR